VEGHELAETMTNPLDNGWYDANGNEIGDKCAWTGLADTTTSAGSFAVQPLWSNQANGCVLAQQPPPGPPAAFSVESAHGDFTGDGKSDLLIVTPRGPSGLNFQVALSDGSSFGNFNLWANTGSNYTIDQSRVLVGDFTGNGLDDIALVTPRGPTGLNIQVALSTGDGFTPFTLWADTGSNYTIDQSQFVTGDFNGDGKTDIAMVTPRGPVGLNYQVALSTGSSFTPFTLWADTGSNYTISQSQVVAGDFNGDGLDDIAIVTPRGTGGGLNYQVALSTGSSFGNFNLWGNTGTNYTIGQSQLFGGDFNGDGLADIGIVTPRGSTGLNYQVALSNGGSLGGWQLWANTGTNYTLDDSIAVG
jgi:hypothetical protein